MSLSVSGTGLRRQGGLTLVELMVALVLSLVLLYGVTTVFMANKETFQLQEGLSRLQEAGRYAIQNLVRDIRRAGYKGCDTRTGFTRNTLNGTSWGNVFDVPVQGFDASGSSAWSPAWSTVSGDPTASISNPSSGSDVVVVNFVEPQGLKVIQHNLPSADIKVVKKANLKIGDIGMVTDCRDAAIFQITNIQTSSGANTNIVHNTGNTDPKPGNATKDLGKKFLGGDFLRMLNRIYYVATGAGGTEPSLWRIDNGGAAVELAEGVEALQLLYGEDTNGDGIADAPYRTASAVTDWSAVTAVRVSLVVRSKSNRVLPSATNFSFNEGQLSVSDRRLRKVFSATVVVRNQLP